MKKLLTIFILSLAMVFPVVADAGFGDLMDKAKETVDKATDMTSSDDQKSGKIDPVKFFTDYGFRSSEHFDIFLKKFEPPHRSMTIQQAREYKNQKRYDRLKKVYQAARNHERSDFLQKTPKQREATESIVTLKALFPKIMDGRKKGLSLLSEKNKKAKQYRAEGESIDEKIRKGLQEQKRIATKEEKPTAQFINSLDVDNYPCYAGLQWDHNLYQMITELQKLNNDPDFHIYLRGGKLIRGIRQGNIQEVCGYKVIDSFWIDVTDLDSKIDLIKIIHQAFTPEQTVEKSIIYPSKYIPKGFKIRLEAEPIYIKGMEFKLETKGYPYKPCLLKPLKDLIVVPYYQYSYFNQGEKRKTKPFDLILGFQCAGLSLSPKDRIDSSIKAIREALLEKYKGQFYTEDGSYTILNIYESEGSRTRLVRFNANAELIYTPPHSYRQSLKEKYREEIDRIKTEKSSGIEDSGSL